MKKTQQSSSQVARHGPRLNDGISRSFDPIKACGHRFGARGGRLNCLECGALFTRADTRSCVSRCQKATGPNR